LSRAMGEDVGTYAISSTLANANYTITFTGADFTITPKAIAIAAEAKTKVYGESDPALTFSINPDLETGDVLTGSLSRATGEDVGTYPISSTLANANYAITFTGADFTITPKAIAIAAEAKTKVYGESDPALTFSINPDLETGDVLTGSLSRAMGEDVGTYAISSTLANANYTITFTGADFTITPKAIAIAADAKTKVYGEVDPALTFSINPALETGDDLTGSLSRATGEDVGTYAISSTLANANYAITFTGADFTITKADQVITFNPISHDNLDSFELTATASSGLAVSYTSSDTLIATINGNVITVLSPGTVIITATQLGDNNFNPAIAITQSLTIATLGVSEDIFSAKDVFLYPNPAKNSLKISLGIDAVEVTIFDVNGKKIQEYTNYISDQLIDLRDFKIGVYLIRIQNNQKMITKRLVKIE
uniref:MBG domain-containing protein n=1 Tax=uncultured Polaribacter sp. TaxID=174711 RepID=UPI00262BF42C